jgi:hypothetical protein
MNNSEENAQLKTEIFFMNKIYRDLCVAYKELVQKSALLNNNNDILYNTKKGE